MKNVLIILFLSLSICVGAQTDIRISGKSLPELQAKELLPISDYALVSVPLFSFISAKSNAPTDVPSMSLPASSVRNIYNYHDLAFFCRLEVKLEQKTNFPVKFRLGDVQYVDYLEGKD